MALESSDLAALHEVLLGLAGRIPDEALVQCRTWLAADELEPLARTLVYLTVTQPVPLMDDELGTLLALAHPYGMDDSLDGAFSLVPYLPGPAYAFQAVEAAEPRRQLVYTDDPIVTAAIVALEAQPQATGMWVAMRDPLAGAQWPPSRRVFVVQVSGDAAAVAGRLQAALRAAGEQVPMVECYQSGTDVPQYHLLARRYGCLVWTREPRLDVLVANGYAPGGEQRRLAADRSGPVLSYLDAGAELLGFVEPVLDMVEPSRGVVVPGGYRTDGVWTWPETASYYLNRYGIAPDADLLTHIDRGGAAEPPDDVACEMAATAVLHPKTEVKPLWVDA
nr:hypothetical protein [Kibdelosporangium sp. MJ126-NF4]CEL16303.1 hypothetical protein [Kibdelosporangium sp. MJ126-NF4]CTQ94227.1 hypothetical protein [Kibdelosporangium sp. MJ126-NF4]